MNTRPNAAEQLLREIFSGNAKHQAAQAAKTEQLTHIRADIRKELTDLVTLDARLTVLAATNHTARVGVITEETIELRDKQTALDRAASHGLHPRREQPGLAWLNPTAVLGTGQIEAPVAVAAASASAEILFALQGHVRRLGRPFRKAHSDLMGSEVLRGICAWPRPWYVTHPVASDGTIRDLANELARLADRYQNTDGLTTIRRDLEHLEARARDVVEGPARSSFTDPCPWCDRKTLVVHHRDPGRSDMFVRCDGRHRCECDDPTCACHRNPHANRHEWINSGSATNTVDGRASTSLVSLISRKKELAILEPKAIAALEEIRAMHQPTWTLPDGTEHTNYVICHTDDLPPGHECVTTELDSCDPESDEHLVPACSECRWVSEDLAPANPFWPCSTYRATELDDDTDQPDPTK